jgi:hypothetical protein
MFTGVSGDANALKRMAEQWAVRASSEPDCRIALKGEKLMRDGGWGRCVADWLRRDPKISRIMPTLTGNSRANRAQQGAL